MSADDIKSFLSGYRDDDLSLAKLEELEFPTFEDFAQCFRDAAIMPRPYELNQGAFHLAMLQLIDEGVVGMDGFKYCWPEVARENRRLCGFPLARSA